KASRHTRSASSSPKPAAASARAISSRRRMRPMSSRRCCAPASPPSVQIERIKVRLTSTRQEVEVTVFSKRAEAIEVVIGEGVHCVRCTLTPTRNGLAYAGNAMGREIVYDKGRVQAEAELNGWR